MHPNSANSPSGTEKGWIHLIRPEMCVSGKQRFLVTQHAVIIVDAQNRFAPGVIEHPYDLPTPVLWSPMCAGEGWSNLHTFRDSCCTGGCGAPKYDESSYR